MSLNGGIGAHPSSTAASTLALTHIATAAAADDDDE